MRAEEIVQNFGIAIATTIAGIALRVFFNQLRQDPVEVERLARLELAEAARRVRRELDGTVVEFGYFRRTVQQSMVEAFEEVRQQVDGIGTKIMGSLEENARKSVLPLEAASQHSGEAIQQLTTTAVAALQNSARELGSQTDRLGESAVRIATSLDEVSSKLSSMQTPERVIEISLEPAVDAFSHAIGELRRENAGQAARQLEMLEGLRAATQSSTEVMPEFSERATEVVRDAAARLSTSADFLKASDARHAERLEVVLARQLEMLEGLRAATQSSTEVMSEFSERATEVVRDAAARLSTSANLLKASDARHAEHLEAVLGRSEVALRSLERSLSDANADQAARSAAFHEIAPSLERSVASLNAGVRIRSPLEGVPSVDPWFCCVTQGKVERQDSSYRRGLVLGLTMAEVMLLLVFCLLIASAVALSFERSQTLGLKKRLAEVTAVEGSREQLADELAQERNELAQERKERVKLAKALESADQTARTSKALVDAIKNHPSLAELVQSSNTLKQGNIDDNWRRLVESYEAVQQLEKEGIPHGMLKEHARAFAAADRTGVRAPTWKRSPRRQRLQKRSPRC
jgi:hypothetical protein